jgi:prohibitin 1
MFFILSVAIAVVSVFIWNNTRKTNLPTATGAGAAAMIFLLIAASQFFTVVPAGSVGVVNFFGTVFDVTLKAGINYVNPLANVIKMSIQTQKLKEVMDVPSKEGLTVQLEVSVLYHLNPEKAADV